MLFGLVFTPAIFAQGYIIEPAPGWVKPAQIPDRDQLKQQNNSNGEAYLLVDFQWQVGESQQSQYRHIVTKALNTTGVSEASQISIDFDPVYETLVLHTINIQRDGRIIDRIDRTRINLIQREEDLDYQIYDGSKTLSIFIDDVRSGDIVEYSYTIKGANPVFSGHFSENLSMQWNVPVGRLHYRVLWPSTRMLHIRNQGTDIEPVKNTSEQYIEYEWNRDNIKEVIADSNIPDWYDPYPVVYLSDIASWDEVTDWAWPLYRPVINTPMQQTITAAIMEQASTPEKRTLAALRFVQDEVRYLGIEMGESSHKPNTPDKVIEQRFGDCKDKSRLLVSLLQGMGIEASSVLVNTLGDLKLKKPLPTPTIFDHAIVLARINGNNYWLDPTRNYQSGNLDALYKPDYDFGLVVSGQSSGLTNMSDDVTTRHSKVVNETFDFRDAADKPVTYQIISHFDRYYADIQRKQFSETSPVELQQSYLNYMAHYFSDIEFADKISITDDNKSNRVTVNEQYSIPNAWSKNDDGRYIFVNFEPYLIADHIKIVEAPIRTMPYAVTHPVRYQHTTRILLPEGSYFDNELITVEDSAFRFTRTVDFSDDVLILDYVYESISDHVKLEHIQSHKNNIREALEISSFHIQMPDPALGLGEYSFDSNDINWPMVILILLSFAATTFLSFKYIYFYDPPYQATEQINGKLEGISGWLVLPALSLIINPLKIAVESSDGWYVFSATQWSIVGDTTGTSMLITIAFEMVTNVAMFVMGLFLIVMFFTRRRSFPRLFIMYFVFCTIVFAVDLVTVHLLPYPELEIEPSDYTELIQMTLYTVIWSLYFIVSKRVKATFTRTRKINKKQLSSPGIEEKTILQDTV
jgi:transglutaminase-like putative cysteine protease